jgi:NAD(P)-dependent dehydrogenase (short-subunit alcohol dehydrogenase family)
LALAKEGCNVIVSDIDQTNCQAVAKELESFGIKSMGQKCDVSNIEEVKNLFDVAQKEFGGLDVLVNNAGIYPFVPFDQLKEADWDKVLNINLKSVFFCSQQALKIMPEGSKIVNISSIAAVLGFAGLTHYCASKGGVSSMTRALAVEVASKKITVNAVAPGAINTPGAQGSGEETKQQTIAAIPLARMGEPEDIANAAVFLASEEARSITGETLLVDGSRSVARGRD